MSTDHSNSLPPFDLGGHSIDIHSQPLAGAESIMAASSIAGIQASLPDSGFVGNQDHASFAATGQDHPGSTTVMPGPKVDAIEFRVIRPGVPVRRLRLTGNRYTFGSAEGCSIRLNDPTLRPMHAVLIRDANRVLVRAYSVPLEINDTRMTETSLQIGDVLRMGAYRFELLSGLDPAGKPASATPSQDAAPQRQNSLDPAAFDPNDHAEQQAWQSRFQREAAQWRLRQSEVDLRENRCIERETELRARETEMWSRADQLYRRETQLMSQETAAMQIQEEYLARKEELARLREESRVQRRLLDERQDQIQNMESEYHQQVANATRQLELSQQQAESATEAVQRMRDQFASLNEQLERLTRQQDALENSDQSHMEQHRQLQRELETARDEAIDARAQSEARCHSAENRVDELTAQLQAIEQNESAQLDRSAESESLANELRQQIEASETRCNEAESRVEELSAQLNAIEQDETAQAERKAESESIASELRQQIDDLEQHVRQATDEASQLREDYEGACASIRQLELLVDQTTNERDEARSGLEIESDALRQSVEQLTRDLGQANLELGEIREANDALTNELSDTRQERDAAVEDAEARPTNEAFDALRVELDTVKSRLEQMQHEYDETLSRIDSESSVAFSVVPPLSAVATPDDSASLTDLADSATSKALGLLGDIVPETADASALDNAEAVSLDLESSELQTSGSEAVDATENVGDHAAVDSLTTDESATATDESDDSEEDDSEAWPTYHSATQDPMASSTSEPYVEPSTESNAWQTTSTNDDADRELDSLISDSVAELATETPPLDPSADDAAKEPTDATSHWRPDGLENVENAGHFSAWEADASQIDSTDDSASVSDSDTPMWHTESPETAVDEAIADIEQNVDQAIAEIDGLSHDIPAADPVADPARSEDSVDHTDPASELVHDDADSNIEPDASMSAVESEWNNTESIADDPEPGFNPWGTPATESEVSDSAEPDMWQSPHEPTPADDSVEAYRPIDPWADVNETEDDTNTSASATDHADGSGLALGAIATSDDSSDLDSEPAMGSLADMLIRDMDQDKAEESSHSLEQSAPGSYQSDDDPVEATFVMDSITPETDDAEPNESPWNLHSPEDVQASNSLADAGSEEDSRVNDDVEQLMTQAMESETPSPAAESPTNEAEDEDDSIEAYMNRLLNRVQGEKNSSQPAEESTVTVSAETELLETQEVVDDSEDLSEPIDPDAPLVPRSQAPERSRNMSAMRDLANQSARSAVARSGKIQARDTQIKAMHKFLGAGTGIACGLLCLYFINQLGMIWCALCTGLGVVVAIMYAQEGMALMKEANARMAAAEGGEEPNDADQVSVSAEAEQDLK